jgi:hypothetical protein
MFENVSDIVLVSVPDRDPIPVSDWVPEANEFA